MDRFTYQANQTDALAADLAARLARGAVGIVPTETVYGLICRASDAAARRHIYDLKARPADKPLQRLIAGTNDFAALGVVASPALNALADAHWPGPLTLVVDCDMDEDSVGLRWPDHDLVCAIIRALGEPLAASSANAAGILPEDSAAREFSDLQGEPDFVVFGDVGDGPASTVARLDADGKITFLREGAISQEELEAALPHP